MERLRIVVRYLDGRVLKGHTDNFSPVGKAFSLAPLSQTPGTEPIAVELKDLKAIFFVKDFGGSSSYVEKKEFTPNQPYMGKKLKLTFCDGEVMCGSSLNYDARGIGFFIFPPDQQANTIRVFAINASLKKVEMIP